MNGPTQPRPDYEARNRPAASRAGTPLRVLLALYALAWPWDVYQYVRPLGITATTGAAMVLGGFAVAGAVRRSKLGVPFELAWPPALMLVLLAAAAFRNEMDAVVLVRWAGALALFLSVVHLAPSPAASRDLLMLSVFSAAIAAAVAVAARAVPSLGIMPTAYSLETGAVLYGPRDVTGGLWMMAFSTVGLAWTISDKTEQKTCRAAAAAALVCVAGAAVGAGTKALTGFAASLSPGPFPVSLAATAAGVIAVWLVARVAAKLYIAWEDSAERPLRLWLAVVCVTASFLMITPMPVRAHHGFLLGLAAAAARMPRGEWGKMRLWILAPVMVLIVFSNLYHVDPANPDDPRNYEAAVARDLSERALDRLERRLDYFEQVAPDDRRLHLWRAKSALVRGDVAFAAAHLAAARVSDPSGRRRELLPPPRGEECEPVMIGLRDAVSSGASPEDLLACARLLVATGEPDSALNMLSMRDLGALENVDDVPVAALAQSAAFSLGDPALSEALHERGERMLRGILHAAGARVQTLPKGYPQDRLPAIVAAWTDVDGVHMFVWAAGESRTAHRSSRIRPDTGDELAWSLGRNEAQSALVFVLGRGHGAEPLATIQLGENGLTGHWTVLSGEDPVLQFQSTSIICIPARETEEPLQRDES